MRERPRETPLPTVLLGSALWRRLDEPAFEICRLRGFADGFLLDGRVLTVLAGEPCEIHYAIVCRADWVTRSAHVTVVDRGAVRPFDIRCADGSRWSLDGVHRPELDGVADVDLGFTPATNTLAVRRLALDIGVSGDSDAAWLRFPELSLERLAQRYTHVSERRYRYESGGGESTAELEVDAQGLVVRYDGLWERVAPPATPS